MSTEQAPEAPTRKRVRFNDENNDEPAEPVPVPLKTSPLSAARALLSSSLESLPDTFRTIASLHGKKFLKLQADKAHRISLIKRYAADDYTPRSARVEFALTATPKVMETPEFTTLAGETKTLVEAFQKALTASISSVTELEIAALDNDINKTVFTLLHDLAALWLVNADPTDDDPPSRALALLCLEKHSSLLEHTMLTRSNVFEQYKKHRDCDEDIHLRGGLDPALRGCLLSHIGGLMIILKPILNDAWSLFNDHTQARATNVALEKLSTLLLTAPPTADTAMAVDTEQTVDAKTLDELIQKRVDEQTKALKTKINQMEQQQKRQPKNEKGGDPKSAPSSKKKTDQKNQDGRNSKKKKGNPQDKRGKATDNAKDSKADKKKDPPKTRRKKSTKKGSNAPETR